MESLDNMTNDDLFKERDRIKQLIAQANTRQQVFKVLANSLYGALGCQYFRFYDPDLATAITLSGQSAVTTAELYVNQYGVLIGKGKSAINTIASDTDSVVGTTEIYVCGKKTTIADYHETLACVKIRDDGDVRVGAGVSYGFDGISVVSRPILYSMKHKVKKKQYRIKTDTSSVVVTEDHSIMVMRCDELVEVKPCDLIDTDRIIKLCQN
jgi:hypothetical protein